MANMNAVAGRSTLRRGKTLTVLLFLLPWLISLVVLWYGPILATAVLSFMRYRLIGQPRLVGLVNYLAVLQDEYFWLGLRNTFVFVALYLPANFLTGLLTAYLLDLDIRLKGLWRSIIYVPSVLPVIAILVLGKFIFYPNGLVNTALELAGIPGPLWLANPRLIIPASVLLMVWQCGTAMVVYLGALQNVPVQYYEAAEIDGLSRSRQFFRITLPLISPTIFFRLVIDLIFALTIFVPGLVLPEGNVPGGPANASRFYALHLYEKAFQRFNIGEASALATILILISVALTWLVIKTGERHVHYEA
jgi:multiple sugar transport system permease protein